MHNTRAGSEDSARRRTANRRQTGEYTRRRRLRLVTDTKIFLGVCGGIARYLGIEAWQARLAYLLGVLLAPGVALLLYFIFWILMKNEPPVTEEEVEVGGTMDKSKARQQRSAQPAVDQSPPRVALRVIQSDFESLEQRLQRIEKFVVSGNYELHKGFSDIGDAKEP